MYFDINSTEVSKYLVSLQTYAYGDLQLFHKLCQDAEKNEALTGTTSSSTTIETTRILGGSMYGPPPISPRFRATIPFALMLLSCIEILGYLTKGDGNENETLQNIKFFLKNLPLLKIEDNDIDFLVLIFRHGLAHAYFPKLNYAVSYRTYNPDTLFFKTPESDKDILNVKHLELCFKLGLETIISESTLYPTMESQYLKLINNYEKKHKTLIEKR